MIDKKGMKRQYKQHVPPMGIFQIKNLVNGKILIGSAKNLHGQINSCKFQLKHGLHMNRALQLDYTQLGEGKFSFEVVDYLEPRKEPNYDSTADLKTLEEMWLDKLQPYDEKGYNRRKRTET